MTTTTAHTKGIVSNELCQTRSNAVMNQRIGSVSRNHRAVAANPGCIEPVSNA